MSELSEFLPVILGDGGEFTEPSVFELGKKARNALIRLEAKRKSLEDHAALATGSTVKIIASAQNENGKYTAVESAEHIQSAERLTKVLGSVGIHRVVVEPEATHTVVLEALADPEVSDIIYVGHSERSNLILDKTITWRLAADEMTHLKHSFGVLGCATSYKDTISPRFGSLLLPTDGILYGKHAGEAWPREAGDLTNFYEVAHEMSDMDRILAAVQVSHPAVPFSNAFDTQEVA